MKKNFVKKLALGLALVMAVTSVPASSEAAAAPGFKSDAVKVRVGQTKKYSTENAKKYSVKFKIGNKKVATIKYTAGSKSVKVTGVAEGKTTLRADFKSYKTKKVTTAKVPVTVLAAKVETPVVEEATLVSVKQTAANAFEATFTTDAREKVTAASFTKIESADETYTLSVKSVEWSADGKTAKVVTYGNFVDATVFNVTCNDKTASFTASIGAVKTAVIDTVTAEANVRTAVKFRLFDANGIDVTSAIALDKYVGLGIEGDYYDVDFTKASKANVTLANVGGEVEITLTYDPVNGTDPITVTGKITCIDTKASVGTTYFTLDDGYATATAAPKVYLESFKEDATLYYGDGLATFYFAAIGANGNAIAYDYIEVESSNEDVIAVVNWNNPSSQKYTEIQLTPEGVGTAKVVITAYKNDVKTVYAETVVVREARKLSSIYLTKNTVAITAGHVNDNDNVAIVLNDQYGNSMPAAEASWDVNEVIAGPIADGAPYGNTSKTIATLSTGSGTAAGNYVMEVAANDGYNTITKRFTVNVRNIPAATVSYKLELNTTSVDLDPEVRVWAADRTGSVKVKVAKYVGTVFAGYDNSKLHSLTVKNGGKYFKGTDLTNTTSTAITTSAVGANLKAGFTTSLADPVPHLTLNTTETAGTTAYHLVSSNLLGAADCVAANGTYTVVATFDSDADWDLRTGTTSKSTVNFTVKNGMELPKLTINSTKADSAMLVNMVQDCVDVDLDVLSTTSSIVDVLDRNFVSVDQYLAPGMKATVKYVKVKDTFKGTDYYYYLPVNRTVVAE